MVELQVAPGRATAPAGGDVCAATAVPLVHRAPDGRGNVTRGGPRVGFLEPLSGLLHAGEALRLQPLQPLGDGLLDDPGEVDSRRERLESLQLVVKLGAGRELDLVPRRGEWLDDGRPGRPVLRAENSVRTELWWRPVPGHRARRGDGRRRSDVGPPGRRRRARRWQLADPIRNVRPRGEARNQLLDLSLRPVRGSLEEGVTVCRCEVRGQLCDAAQVEATRRQQGQEHRMLPGSPRHRDPQVGLVLREVKDVGRVREHRRRRLPSVEPTGVHLGDVGDQVRLDPPRPSDELAQPMQQLLIGEGMKRVCVVHACNIGGHPARICRRACAAKVANRFDFGPHTCDLASARISAGDGGGLALAKPGSRVAA